MKLFPLLLRLILCISLVVNGVGAAQASMRMEIMQAARGLAADDSGSATAARMSPDASPCHRHQASPHAVPTAEAHAATAHSGPSPAGGKTDPCCHDRTCSWPSTPASLAPMTAFADACEELRAGFVSAPVGAYPQPRLPHLIRPPIG